MGRSVHHPAGRRHRHFVHGGAAVHGGHLVHLPHPSSAGAAVPGYDRRRVRKKARAGTAFPPFQTLVISTATRVGMGNLVGVVAAVSAGGAGAVFWMWVTAILGASTSFIESTLAQKYRQPDPLYGGWRGGPAYYLHVLAERRRGKKSSNALW